MLVLSRKPDERIVILKDGTPLVTITVARIQPSVVRLGFDADPEYKIVRKEILDATSLPPV